MDSQFNWRSQGRRGRLKAGQILQGLVFWMFGRGIKVSLGTVSWYRSSYGTDFDLSEIAGSVIGS